MNCPICNEKLEFLIGDSIHRGNENYGITLYCANWQCDAQEVMGHGANAKIAYEVILQKFKTHGQPVKPIESLIKKFEIGKI